MRDIIISAGHGGSDPGASGNGLIERDECIWLRDAICIELDKYQVKYKKDRNQDALAATLSFFKSIWKPTTIAIDIHFNASPKVEANGTEVFIPDNATTFEKNLAGSILKDLVLHGSFKNRGIKTPKQSGRGTLGWFRPNAEQCLIEVCFLSNKLDAALWKANRNNIAKAIAKTIAEYTKK